jgi:hypothetical protein
MIGATAEERPGTDAYAQAVTLDRIGVTARLPKPAPAPAPQTAPPPVTNTASPAVDGYVANTTSVATKVTTPLVDVPQSVSVVTKEHGLLGLGRRQQQHFARAAAYVPRLVHREILTGARHGSAGAPHARGDTA